MTIGIIGIGSLTLELASRASHAGYKVIVNNPRGNSLVRETLEKTSPNIHLTTLQQAATADLVILFVPKNDLEQVISDLPDMTGKTLVHTSGLIFNPQSLLSGLNYAMTYKITASLLPTAHVVKLFKPLKLETGTTESQNRDEIFYIADHAPSSLKVKTFLNALYFSAIDLSSRLRLNHTGLNDGTSFFSLGTKY